VLLGAILTLAAPSPALAQSEAAVQEARELVRRGNAAYQVGRIEEARTYYERAHQLRPRPGTLFNLAQCYRQLRLYTKAIFLYRSYLEASPNAPDRVDVEKTIERLKDLQEKEQSAQGSPPLPSEIRGPTGGVLPARDASGPTTTAPVGATEEPSNPWYRRWYVWTVVGVLVAGAVVAGAVVGTRSSTVDVPVPSSGLGNQTFFGAR
jgi:tetratricopeptide (TPR) repeat protein